MKDMAEERRSPSMPFAMLMVGFALIAIASVFTVLVPELSSDDEEAAESGEAESGEADSAEAESGEADSAEATGEADPGEPAAPTD